MDKLVTKCVKNCKKRCELQAGHTNQDCHMMKSCFEVAKPSDEKKEDKKRKERICKVCCLEKKCMCKINSPRQKCICCKNKGSPETHKTCCCVLTDCICNEVKVTENTRPRTLYHDLPLYDEKSHLLGYIKKGAIIDEPFCARSQDTDFQNASNSCTDKWSIKRRGVYEEPRSCMASCCYAEGVKRDIGETFANVPRWTTKSAFQNAVSNPSRTLSLQRPPIVTKIRTKPCPCGE